jgi:phospholipid transport system substrate-binding protein
MKPVILEWRRHSLIALFAGLLVTLSLSNDAYADAGTNFVNRVAGQVLAIVGSSASDAQKAGRFAAVLSANADLRRIATFALGKYNRKVRGAQRAQYQSLVRRFIMNVYFTRLNEFSRGTTGKVTVTGSKVRSKDIIVSSNIVFANGRTIPVKWRLTKGVRLFDLSVSGIWLALEQRSVFVSIISRNNGDVKPLLDHLRKSG